MHSSFTTVFIISTALLLLLEISLILISVVIIANAVYIELAFNTATGLYGIHMLLVSLLTAIYCSVGITTEVSHHSEINHLPYAVVLAILGLLHVSLSVIILEQQKWEEVVNVITETAFPGISNSSLTLEQTHEALGKVTSDVSNFMAILSCCGVEGKQDFIEYATIYTTLPSYCCGKKPLSVRVCTYEKAYMIGCKKYLRLSIRMIRTSVITTFIFTTLLIYGLVAFCIFLFFHSKE